jgi:hypothetical protein
MVVHAAWEAVGWDREAIIDIFAECDQLVDSHLSLCFCRACDFQDYEWRGGRDGGRGEDRRREFEMFSV